MGFMPKKTGFMFLKSLQL